MASKRATIVILALGATAICALDPARAANPGLKTQERKFSEILMALSTRHSRDPMFRCYQLGRLRAFADVLSIRINNLSAQEAGTNDLLERARQLHTKAESVMNGRIYDCDPAFPLQSEGPRSGNREVITQIKSARKRLKKVDGEDLVIRCFHIGRLGILGGRLSQMLRRQYVQGRRGDPADHALLNRVARDLKQKAADCSAHSES